MEKAELNSQPANQIMVNDGDEIDLLALARAILKTWKVVFVFIVAVTLGFALFQILNAWRQPENTTYLKIIQLTFEGVNNGVYPNGVPFKLQDILAPAILESVYEKHLQPFQAAEIDAESFYQSLSISPYTPEYGLIVKKYDAIIEKINNRTIDVNDLELIRKKQDEELQTIQNGRAKLVFDTKGIAVDKNLVTNILSAVPAEWARLQVEDKGVLGLDLDLPSSLVLDKNVIESVDYVVLNDLLTDKIDLLQESIERLAAQVQVSAGIKDPVTNMTLADLQQTVADFSNYIVDNMMSPVLHLGLTKNRDFSTFYYNDKKRKLEEKLNYLSEQANLIKSAYNSYNDTKEGALILELPTGQVSSQINKEFLNQLVDINGKTVVEKYRQALNDRWLETNIQAAKIKSRLREINLTIESIQSQNEHLQAVENHKQYLQQVDTKALQIIDDLKSYYDAMSRIAALAGHQSIGRLGYLYRDIHSEPIQQQSYQFDTKRLLLQYLALIFITTLLVVPATIFRNTLKKTLPGSQRGEEVSSEY